MDRRQRNDLDRHITGNYGADQERRHTSSRDDGGDALAEPSKHAWRVGKIKSTVVTDCDTGNDDLGSVAFYGGHLVAESVNPALAPLIAAAPDLLAALEGVTTLATSLHEMLADDEDNTYQREIDDEREMLRIARDAIKKACGE